MNNQSSVQILKFVVSIFFIMIILSLFGTVLTSIIGIATGTIGYFTTGGLFLFISDIVEFVGFCLDTLFLNNFSSYTYVFTPTITIFSLNFILSFFRICLGSTLIIIVFSLIFGKKG